MNHPTLAQLQAFDTGQLPPDERAPIERHLESCPECCGALDTLPEGALEALLRAFAPGAENGDPGAAEVPAGLVGHPRYRILGVVGAGGMGVVYKAVHRLMERVVALKVLKPSLTDRPGFVERFRREVKAAARLSHPNIVAAHDADEAAGTHFLVMEYAAGESLDRELARRGPLPVPEACALVAQAALGLQYAHERGMVHCDVKPHNLVRTSVGQVKILDFGLARVVTESSEAAPSLPSGTLVGTPDYVAPEQARDPKHADIRSDIYSLGCTLYHLLSGRPPFDGGTPLQKLMAHQECAPPPLARDDVPPALNRILERMLAKDPALRYATPAEVAAELAVACDPPSTAPASPPPRRFRRALTVAAAALLVVVALAIVAYWAPLPFGAPPPSPNAAPVVPSEPPAPAAAPQPPVAAALLGPAELARDRRLARDRAVDWLRANNSGHPEHPVVGYVTSHIDRDLDGAEAFQVLLGPALVKSAKATLLVGRAGTLHVFELDAALGREVPAGGCRVQNYSIGDDRRRATACVVLSDLAIDGADHLAPERPVAGSVTYRITSAWPKDGALRLTFYFGKRKRSVLLARVPDADHGTLHFSFPPLDEPQQVMAGPDVLFVEVVTQDDGRTTVESNAAATAVRVMAPEAARPGGT
jgi:hypothetical protein